MAYNLGLFIEIWPKIGSALPKAKISLYVFNICLWTACQKLTTPLDYKLVKAAGSSKDAIEKAMSDVAFVGDKNDELLEVSAMTLSLKAFLAC